MGSAFRSFWLSLVFLFFVNPVWADESEPAGEVPSVSTVQAHNPDPWEGFNRAMYRFNDTLDRFVLRPAAVGYKKVMPQPARTGVTNFFSNLRMPIVMLNDLLQGKVKQAGKDTTRFVVNSTIGIAGLVDVARRMSLQANDEDFGQTLGKWGMRSGPYLVIPFVGPSSFRDALGLGVDSLTNPRNYVFDAEVNWGLWVVDGVNSRASLLDVEEIVQGDKYLFIRDLYLQRRAFLINDGQVEDPFMDDDFDDEELEEEAAPDNSAGADSESREPDEGEQEPVDTEDKGSLPEDTGEEGTIEAV